MSKEDCYICKELKEEGKYVYEYGYVEIQISKDDNGKYRCWALGESTASIPCNYCPNCGRLLDEKVIKEKNLFDLNIFDRKRREK